MKAWAKKLTQTIQLMGDPFTVSGVDKVGVFAPISPSSARTYLTDTEIASYGRPLRLAYVRPDDTTASGATVLWNGTSLTVRKVVEVRADGEALARLLILA